MKLAAIATAAITLLFAISALGVSSSTISANNQSKNPSGLTAELCGDAVCLSWTPGTIEYTSQHILIWESYSRPDGGAIATMNVDEESTAQIPLAYMRLIPLKEEHGDHITFSFRVVAVEMGVFAEIDREYSERATLHIPRSVMYPPLSLDVIYPPGESDPSGE